MYESDKDLTFPLTLTPPIKTAWQPCRKQVRIHSLVDECRVNVILIWFHVRTGKFEAQQGKQVAVDSLRSSSTQAGCTGQYGARFGRGLVMAPFASAKLPL
eukprot:1150081-Pelagomonas_calceolata.AAC.3